MPQDVVDTLDIPLFILSLWRKQVRDGVIVAKSANLDIQTKAELKRLREMERSYKVLKEVVNPGVWVVTGAAIPFAAGNLQGAKVPDSIVA